MAPPPPAAHPTAQPPPALASTPHSSTANLDSTRGTTGTTTTHPDHSYPLQPTLVPTLSPAPTASTFTPSSTLPDGWLDKHSILDLAQQLDVSKDLVPDILLDQAKQLVQHGLLADQVVTKAHALYKEQLAHANATISRLESSLAALSSSATSASSSSLSPTTDTHLAYALLESDNRQLRTQAAALAGMVAPLRVALDQERRLTRALVLEGGKKGGEGEGVGEATTEEDEISDADAESDGEAKARRKERERTRVQAEEIRVLRSEVGALRADKEQLQARVINADAETAHLKEELNQLRSRLLHGAPLIANDHEVDLSPSTALDRKPSAADVLGAAAADPSSASLAPSSRPRRVQLGDAEAELLLSAGKKLSHIRRIERVPLSLAIRQQAEEIVQSQFDSHSAADGVASGNGHGGTTVLYTSTSAALAGTASTSMAVTASTSAQPVWDFAAFRVREQDRRGGGGADDGFDALGLLAEASAESQSSLEENTHAHSRPSQSRKTVAGLTGSNGNGFALPPPPRTANGRDRWPADPVDDDCEVERQLARRSQQEEGAPTAARHVSSESKGRRSTRPPTISGATAYAADSDGDYPAPDGGGAGGTGKRRASASASAGSIPLVVPSRGSTRTRKRSRKAREEEDSYGDDGAGYGDELDAEGELDAAYRPSPPPASLAFPPNAPPPPLSAQHRRTSSSTGAGGGKPLGRQLSALDVLVQASSSAAEAAGASAMASTSTSTSGMAAGGSFSSSGRNKKIKHDPDYEDDADPDYTYPGGGYDADPSSSVYYYPSSANAPLAHKSGPVPKKARLPYTKWNLQEDEALLKAVIQCGCAWDSVAKLCPTRAYHQVRQRFLRGLRSGETIPPELKHLQPAVLKSVKDYEEKKRRKKEAKKQAQELVRGIE
ncbi:hypothetical protein JCM8097_008323 [Rhodosporidiobolus ruineniae]